MSSEKSVDDEVISHVLQFLKGRPNRFRESIRLLEMESRVFFDDLYVKDCVLKGSFDEAEKYLVGFGLRDNDDENSKNLLYTIETERIYEGLKRKDGVTSFEFERKQASDKIGSLIRGNRILAPITQFPDMNEDTLKNIVAARLKRPVSDDPKNGSPDSKRAKTSVQCCGGFETLSDEVIHHNFNA